MENRVLEDNRVVLVRSGHFRELRDHLLQEGVLSMEETESIEAERTRHERMSTLLDVMFRKPVEFETRLLECLREADEVLYKQLDLSGTKGKGRVEPMSPPGARALCDPHKQTITLFCWKCDVALCQLCLKESHSGHEIRSIEHAVLKKKGFLESRMSSWADRKHSLEEARDRLYSLNDELEKASDQRIAEINNRYEKLHQKHEMRRQEEITKVKSSKGKSSNKILGPAHAADSKLEKMADTHKRFVELSRSDESFVKEATDLAKRMDEQASSAEKEAENVRKQIKEMLATLQESTASAVKRTDTGSDNLPESPQTYADANTQTEGEDQGGPQDTPTATPTNTPTYSCASTQTPEEISLPEFRFTRADGWDPERVVIEAGGAAVSDGPERARWATTVRTDGLLGADRRVYWETRLDWSPVSVPGSGWSWVGGVGVRREDSHFGRYPGDDDQSWGVRILYNHSQNSWRYVCWHVGKSIFRSAPVTATSPSVSHHLGFMLDPGAGTLTAVDVNTNSPICTFSLPAGDAGSQRLVPLVGFWSNAFERRFSLAGVNPSRLPGAVTDLLN